jgi:hypothetical protein
MTYLIMAKVFKVIIYTLLYGVALAMGVSSIVLSSVGELNIKSLGIILGIGLLCLLFAGVANIKSDTSDEEVKEV